MYMYSPVAIVRVQIRSVSTDVAVDIHLLISAKPKLQYYAGAVSQVSHVPGQMTLEMHQDAHRCVKCRGHYIWRSQAADKRPGYGQMLPLRVSSIAYQHRREHCEAREDPQRLFSVVVCRSVAR